MHPCRHGRDGGNSALHIVNPWFDPGRDTRAPLQALSKGWPIVSAASALSSRRPPRSATLLRRRDTYPAALDETLLIITWLCCGPAGRRRGERPAGRAEEGGAARLAG